MRTPSVDLYSPSGVPLYYGTDPKANVAFIRALPRSIPHTTSLPSRPTLKETIEMLDELKPDEAALLAGKEYTVFALTFRGPRDSKEQDEAVQELKKRARRIGINVIDVRLHG